MSTPAATGLISSYLDNWRSFLATSATLQTLLGAADAAAAKAKIVQVGSEAAPPRVLITHALRLVKQAVQGFGVQGSLIAEFELPAAEGDIGDDNAILINARNDLGGVMDDLAAAIESNTAGTMDLRTLELDDEHFVLEDDDGSVMVASRMTAEVMGQ